MNSHVDQIKEKVNILDLVSQYVKLEKSGSTYKGKSPFTSEKTPSFFVHPDKGFFYCFSSGKGGDIFNFVQELERMDFRESLVFLAEKAGVSLDDLPQQNDSTARLYEILDLATKWYETELRKNKPAVKYLLGRGLTKDTLIKFRIGFALDSWDALYSFLRKRKYTDQEMLDAGLIVPRKNRQGYYDRFRSRIMFPLMDSRGRVIGFSGRIFGPEDAVAKYMNSPEGPLFHKSKVLYGYHSAKQAISKKDECILVEGQFDVLLAQQSGYKNTLAISGTGLTDGHVAMVSRFASRVLLALDSDNAGVKATKRSILVALKHNLEVKIISLLDGKDPADTIAENPYEWEVAVRDAKDYLDYRIEIFLRKSNDLALKQKLVHEELFLFVSFVQSAIAQDFMLQKISHFLGASLDAVRKDFSNYKPDEAFPVHKKVESEKTEDILGKDEELINLILYLENKELDGIKMFSEKFAEVYKKDLVQELEKIPEEKKNISFFVLENRFTDIPNNVIIDNVNELFSKIMRALLEQERKKISQDIQNAVLTNSPALAELLQQKNILDKKIDTK